MRNWKNIVKLEKIEQVDKIVVQFEKPRESKKNIETFGKCEKVEKRRKIKKNLKKLPKMLKK